MLVGGYPAGNTRVNELFRIHKIASFLERVFDFSLEDSVSSRLTRSESLTQPRGSLCWLISCSVPTVESTDLPALQSKGHSVAFRTSLAPAMIQLSRILVFELFFS